MLPIRYLTIVLVFALLFTSVPAAGAGLRVCDDDSHACRGNYGDHHEFSSPCSSDGTCPKCDGSKKCWVCSGSGKNLSGDDCSICGGSGKCSYCGGTGKS